MLTEIILTLAALLLGVYCLIRSVRTRGEIFFPLPKGLPALLKSRAVWLGVTAALPVTAAVSLAEMAAESLNASARLTAFLHAAYLALLGVLILALLLHTVNRFRRTRGNERRTALALLLIAAAGVAVEAVWAVRVAVFFVAAALFGWMLLFGRGAEPYGTQEGRRFQTRATLLIALTFLAVIAANAALILNLSSAQSEELGNTRLDVIRGDLQETITGAETGVMRVAFGAEQLLESGASREELAAYFMEQREKLRSDDSFMNTYIAGKDWHVVPGFDAPADFHAAERVWYLGAMDVPGGVYVSEPYQDADTGAMCFTVSTRLSDGETVVGMDLNFSKAQESILEMTRGSERTAMIVTSGGLIVGYTDPALIGARADEKLPEYADILRRVTASQEHGSFRAELNGRPCVIFSSETSNAWYLILAVDTGALYGESYRQIALMASVNLLMLALVVVYYLLSARTVRRAEEKLAESRSAIDGVSGKMRELAAQLLRLGDARLFGEDGDPAELIGMVRESGQKLSAMFNALASHSEAHRTKEEAAHGWKEGASSAPSRRVLNGVVVSMLVSLVIVLAFCISISVSWGTTRLNRELDSYEYQLSDWLSRNKSILYMFTDSISHQPALLDDYDAAVDWLGDIAEHYPEISLCYMANPYAEHPVIMSNGWEPGEDFRPETRPWYRATERAADGFNISEPYLDAQTGNYCITLSRVVNGKKGEFLGVFGIDFFLDKLINVLGESYTSPGYAFLVDSEGVIINHPNGDYQMGGAVSTSVEDTEYAEAYNRNRVTTLRDYGGHVMACLSRRTGSGFTVLVAERWRHIYGNTVLVTLVFLALFGACLGFIVALIIRLIRWQEETNRQLFEAAEAARSANQAKSQFLSQMSHEIRTPMNAIIGLDNIALRNEDLSPRTRDELEKIGASARHMLALINDILDMSRIESGRMALRHERFALREFLNQVCIIINSQCEDKGLRFDFKRVEPLDEYFVGDDMKLKQVLINILGNSVKFTEAPGVITFTAEQAETTDDRALLRFTMEDTGIGMDKAFIPKLFEAFSQEDSGSTNRYGGSGLGMAITKSFVEMMGGTIEVESEKGLGSTFRVTVSLERVNAAEVPQVSAQEASVEAASLVGRHILIAEDQQMNAEILTDLLEMEDMSSEWAENGEIAVEVFAGSEAGQFDAILMDMRMPVMDGLGATREIRKLDRPDARTVPIIALTANAFEENVKQCLEAGMDAHLSKPVDVELLKQTLGRLLAERK